MNVILVSKLQDWEYQSVGIFVCFVVQSIDILLSSAITDHILSICSAVFKFQNGNKISQDPGKESHRKNCKYKAVFLVSGPKS